jgi:hypothetical protein
MSVIVIVVLHEFFVLQMSVLLLNVVKLVSQGDIVFVTLLDFEDFSLELTDQQVLLVAGQMD